jgi:putative tryptophan/tyrosine transport system substrate-binding protein
MHIGVEMFKQTAKVDMTYLPYPGAAPEINALLGQHVTSGLVSFPNVSEQLAAGTLRALAVLSSRRIGQLPATGFTNMALELSAKRLEVLHQMLPRATRMALLVTPYSNAEVVRVTRDAASAIGTQIDVVSVSTNQDIEGAFANFADAKTEALMVPTSPLFGENRAQLVALAARHKMPTIYYDRPFVAAGGLMSYGASVPDQARQVGIYTGRILAGEKPADLPVQQATRVDLVLNLKTAKALGHPFPATLLARADEVIE